MESLIRRITITLLAAVLLFTATFACILADALWQPGRGTSATLLGVWRTRGVFDFLEAQERS